MRRRLCTRHGDVLVRQARLDAVLNQLRPMRNLHPRPVARRLVALLNTLDLLAPELVDVENTRPLHLLARVPWRRTLDTWRGGTLRELYEYLLVGVHYPLPGFLWSVLQPDRHLRVGVDGLRAIQLLALLGSGGSLRDAQKCALIPHCVSKRANHALWLVEEPQPVGQALRRAQVSALGGPRWLGTALGVTQHLARVRSDELWWSRVIQWLSDGAPHLAHHQVQPLVDFLVERWNGRPVWRSRVRTVLRSMAEWHAGLAAQRAVYHHGPLPRSALVGATMELYGVPWTVHEICTSRELFAEGGELQHCVATYQTWILRRRSAIFSLREEGARRVTVEVRLAERTVVQGRGYANRYPTDVEREAIRVWAEKNGLQIRGF